MSKTGNGARRDARWRLEALEIIGSLESGKIGERSEPAAGDE